MTKFGEVSSEIIMKSVDRKKKEFPRFSIRWMAPKLGISHVYLGYILKGQRAVPLKMVEPLCEILDIDDNNKSRIYRDLLSSQGFEPLSKSSNVPAPQPQEMDLEWQLLSEKDFSFIAGWETTAIMLATQLQSYDGTPGFVAKYLGLPESLVSELFQVLFEKDFMTVVDGKAQVTAKFYEFQTKRSIDLLWKYSHSVTQKALTTLEEKKTPEDRARRLFTGATVTCSAADLDRLKELLNSSLRQFLQEVTKSKSEEVYQINLQFFPLSSK